MYDHSRRSIAMISTHGYVSAKPELGKPDTGGQVVYVLELSKCLARMGYDVEVWTRQFEDQPATEQVSDEVVLRRFPCGGNEFIPKETLCDAIPEWVGNVRRHLRNNRLLCPMPVTHYWDAGLAGRLLSGHYGVPHVHVPHSLGTWKRDNMPGDPAEKERRYNFSRRIREETRVYHQAARIVATTTQQRELLVAGEYALSAEKIRVIPPGYDDMRFFPVSSATRHSLKRQLGMEGHVVLGLGRLARNKGYDLLIRAMAPVVRRLPEVRLVLCVGSTELSDDERHQLESLKKLTAELALTDNVDFRDYVPDEQLADYYRAADVFALSSRYEPFGMTAVEAMACGTPSVITTEGGLWGQVQWGVDALYADPNDPEAFGHSIYQILNFQQLWSHLSLNGARRVRSRFTWTSISQQLIAVLEGAIGGDAMDAEDPDGGSAVGGANLVFES